MTGKRAGDFVNSASRPRAQRVPDFVLTLDELRAVTAFNVACAERVIDVFEDALPGDLRPRAALESAAVFAQGGPRANAQRIGALAAHRAAKDIALAASHAAMAAGDAAASAYLHPLADAVQVGHILRGPAHCVIAQMQRPVEPASNAGAVRLVLDLVTPLVVDVLLRYPRAVVSRREVATVMCELDATLRRIGA